MTFREEKTLLQGTDGAAIKKSVLRKIDSTELPDKMPCFRNSSTTKDNVIAEWLKEWIDTGVSQGKLSINDLLPSKKEIAEKTKVSIGTVQTAIKMIEDDGYVASKQRIGTFICDRETISDTLRKQTSKRELAIESIKRYIVKEGFEIGQSLPSSREISKEIGRTPNTTRLAIEFLTKSEILEAKVVKGTKSNLVIKSIPSVESNSEVSINTDTLVDQIERELKAIITEKYVVGDKLMSHYEIADTLKVSIKTVHDAMKRLIEQGILQSRRGKYGTYILRIPSDKHVMTGKENEIFAPATEASLYNYEKVKKYLNEFINNNFKPGDKLPAMSKLANELKVSSNTIRKALQILEEEGIVSFSRGRYGGTFLQKMPEVESNKNENKPILSWLSVNPEYTSAYSQN